MLYVCALMKEECYTLRSIKEAKQTTDKPMAEEIRWSAGWKLGRKEGKKERKKNNKTRVKRR